MPRTTTRRVATLLCWAVILGVGAFVRFHRLDTAPAGLWYDEGLAGENAMRVVNGERPIFYFNDDYPEEPLYFYLQAAMLHATNGGRPAIWPLRATSALLGLLTLPAFFLLARQVLPRRWALLATGLLAVFPWHVHFSRLGFRTIMTPLMVSLVGAALLAWTRRLGNAARAPRGARDAGLAALAGVLLGAALYTYTAANSMVPAVALFLAAMTWRAWRTTSPADLPRSPRRRAWLLGLAAGLAAALVVFAPLGVFYLGEGADVTRRLRSVGPAAEGWSLLASLRAVGGLFFLAGDEVFKHGPPYRPVFPFVFGALFLAGLAWAVARAFRRGGAPLFLLLTGAGFLAASVFSVHAPNKLRSLGALPAVLLCFVIGWRLAVAAVHRLGARRWQTRTVTGVALALLLVGEAGAVFYGWYASAEMYQAFSGPFTQVAQWARGAPDAPGAPRDPLVPLYLPRTIARHATVRYLTQDAPLVRPLDSLATALADARARPRPMLYLLVTPHHPPNTELFERLQLPGVVVAVIAPPDRPRDSWAAIVRIDLSSLPSPLPSELLAAAAAYFVEY